MPHNFLRSVVAKPVHFYANDESGIVCLKVQCAVNDIGCLLNLTRSIQWQHVSLPTISTVNQPIVLVRVQTATAPADTELGTVERTEATNSDADPLPVTFAIVGGNEQGLFDVVDGQQQPHGADEGQRREDVERNSSTSDETTRSRVTSGSLRLLRPLHGPSRHTITLQMDVRSRQNIIMSQHIVHITIYVSRYRF
jgi:hypothetical protein